MERSVGIVIHRTRPEALTFAMDVISWLQQRSLAVRLEPETAHRLGLSALACDSNGWAATEFLITLGGDGTILTAARMVSPHRVPIVGVHMGRFGFIAETHPNELFPHLEQILDGRMRIEERLMVHAEVWRNGTRVHHGVGLNEALVKSRTSHLLNLKTYLGGALFATYPADGLIVATPTGSTGYALSAGGPLIAPTVQVFAVVPISPHTLSARPLIVPCEEIIEIEIESDGGEMIFDVDGVEPFSLQTGDRVLVHRADYVTRLIVLDHATFYRKVRNRYLYGERLNG